MERTEQNGFWDARRRAFSFCLIGLGLISLIALVRAQKPGDKNLATIQKSSLEVNLSLLPGKQEPGLELRVRTNPLVKTPPEVEFQDMAGGSVRVLKIEPDEKGNAWIATITDLEQFGVGYLYVTVKDDSGIAERHQLRFATRGTNKDQPSVLYSADGRFGLVVLAGDMPADTRFLVTTLQLPDPQLPAGVTIEAGPFQIMATQQIPDQVKASIVIGLPETSPNNKSPGYQVRWLNPDKAAWELLPSTVDSNNRVTQADVSRLGMFVLTSESK